MSGGKTSFTAFFTVKRKKYFFLNYQHFTEMTVILHTELQKNECRMFLPDTDLKKVLFVVFSVCF